jgi:transposase
MARKTGIPRTQYGLFATPLEEMIDENNEVRVIDAFVNSLDLDKLGFKGVADNRMGASSYSPAVLLKIYFYGYFNRIRSSRCLERECARNVEMMWLIDRQTPSYHTISTFRTFKETDADGKVLFNHRKALVNVFKTFNRFLDQIGLFGKQTFAIDGTKIAAQNSKKKHLSADKLARKLERVDTRIDEYMAELDAADLEPTPTPISERSTDILNAIAELAQRRETLLHHQDLLQKATEADPSVTQICFTDPDARMLPINNEGMMMIAYNVQSTVDDKFCLIADFSVENQKDVHLLAPRAISVKNEFNIIGNIDVLADKGYHSAKGLHGCAESQITTFVAYPEQAFKDKPEGYQKKDFFYNAEKDVYICPAKNELKTTGTLHEKTGRQGHSQGQYKLYRSSFTLCSNCPFKVQCLSKTNIEQRHGRTIERNEFEQAAIDNKNRLLQHRDKYKRRQAIVEHPFGTIKRHWGCYFTLLKSKEKVAGEIAITFSVYNLRRAINLLTQNILIECLKSLVLPKSTATFSFSRFMFVQPSVARPKIVSLRLDLKPFARAA